MTAVTASGKPKRTRETMEIERRFRHVIRLFLAGEMPNFNHQRHVHVANIMWHLPYGKELMHLGLQTMAYRNFVPDKYSAEITNIWWEKLDGTLPTEADFADIPGGVT